MLNRHIWTEKHPFVKRKYIVTSTRCTQKQKKQKNSRNIVSMTWMLFFLQKQPNDLIISNKVFSYQDNNHLPTENNLVYMVG